MPRELCKQVVRYSRDSEQEWESAFLRAAWIHQENSSATDYYEFGTRAFMELLDYACDPHHYLDLYDLSVSDERKMAIIENNLACKFFARLDAVALSSPPPANLCPPAHQLRSGLCIWTYNCGDPGPVFDEETLTKKFFTHLLPVSGICNLQRCYANRICTCDTPAIPPRNYNIQYHCRV